MKLRKDQRYTAYCIMLAEIKEVGFFCFCMALFDFPEDEKVMKWYFPELYKHKPINNYHGGSQWFSDKRSGVRKRKEILEQCIIETSGF